MQLTIDNLTKEFTTDAGEHIVALSDINLEIRDSEFICLLGPSGCGKTTLLRIIGGLDQPSSGQVILDNQVITRPNPRMAMIFQESATGFFSTLGRPSQRCTRMKGPVETIK